MHLFGWLKYGRNETGLSPMSGPWLTEMIYLEVQIMVIVLYWWTILVSLLWDMRGLKTLFVWPFWLCYKILPFHHGNRSVLVTAGLILTSPLNQQSCWLLTSWAQACLMLSRHQIITLTRYLFSQTACRIFYYNLLIIKVFVSKGSLFLNGGGIRITSNFGPKNNEFYDFSNLATNFYQFFCIHKKFSSILIKIKMVEKICISFLQSLRPIFSST